MDEATSALDRESEQLVADALARARHNRTVLMISHRLSTIQSADRIAVLEAGQVVQIGNYDELAADSTGSFAQVVLQQKSLKI